MPFFRCIAVVASLGATAAMLGASPTAAAIPPDLSRYLLQVAKFTQADLVTLENGTVLARVMSGTTETEVMVVAAVKIRATRAQTVSYYGQMVAYVDGTVTQAFGRFSAPPALSDMKDLALDADDVAHLRSCQPGDCDLRIGGAALERIRSSVNWTAPDAAAQANARVREAIVSYVGLYMKTGDSALVTYNDRSEPVSLQKEWQAIMAASPYFQQYNAALKDYLTDYPRRTLNGAKDIIYWVKEDYTGLKPVISVVHGVIYEDPATPDRTVVLQKQLYASHYYDGSFAVAIAAGGLEGATPVTYLLYANRSRGDLLKGGFGGLRRSVARNQAQSAAAQTLGTIKTVLERAGGR